MLCFCVCVCVCVLCVLCCVVCVLGWSCVCLRVCFVLYTFLNHFLYLQTLLFRVVLGHPPLLHRVLRCSDFPWIRVSTPFSPFLSETEREESANTHTHTHTHSGFVHKQINFPNIPVQTVKGGPQTWQWVVGPLGIYLCERFYR